MASVLNGVETLPKISIAGVGRTNVTDRQTIDNRQTTDRRQTDGRPMTYSEREWSMDGHGTKWRRNSAENFNRLSRAHERYRLQTDRQTDLGRHIASLRSLKLTTQHEASVTRHLLSETHFLGQYLTLFRSH